MDNISELLNIFEKEITKTLTPHTVMSYSHSVSNFLHYLKKSKDGSLNYTDIEVKNYVKSRHSEGISNGTLITELGGINTYSKFLNNDAFVKPTEIVYLKTINETKKELTVLSKQFQEHLYKDALISSKKRNISMVLLFLETGMKISELVLLNASDVVVNGQAYYIKIAPEKERLLPISKELCSHLMRQLYQKETDAPLFRSNAGNRISIRSVQTNLRKYAVTSQILRDTFVFNLLDTDTDTYIISQLIGLADLSEVARKYYKNEIKVVDMPGHLGLDKKAREESNDC